MFLKLFRTESGREGTGGVKNFFLKTLSFSGAFSALVLAFQVIVQPLVHT